MHHAHIKAILEGVIPEVKSAISAAVNPLLERLAALEQRAPERGENGKDGLNGKDGRDGIDGKDGAVGRDGIDGKDGQDGAPGRDGIDGKDGAVGRDGIDGKDGQDGAPGRDGIDGKDGDPGKDGVDGKDGEPGKDGVDGKDGAPGLIGKDGVDGKDGRDGLDGKDGAAGRDGKDGAPGRDASDLSTIMDIASRAAAEVLTKTLKTKTLTTPDGGRTFVESYTLGEDEIKASVKTWMPLDKGVWREGQYEAGDGVTRDGQFFIAQRDTTAEPMTDAAKDDWRLAVKRGRNGRDFRPEQPKASEPVRFK